MRIRFLLYPALMLWCFVRIVSAQDAPSIWQPSYILNFVTLVGAAAAIIYGVWNRKTYAGLQDTISEYEKSKTAREARFEEDRLRCAATIAGLERDIGTLKIQLTTKDGINEAVTSQNLQMKAILRKLRKEGKWEGDEDDIFNQTYEQTNKNNDRG